MAFADHSRRLDEAVMSNLGDGPCNYQGADGVLAGVSHILDLDFEVMDEDQVAMRVTTVSVRVLDVARSRQGDKVVTPVRTWTVQQILEDDGHIRRLWVS